MMVQRFHSSVRMRILQLHGLMLFSFLEKIQGRWSFIPWNSGLQELLLRKLIHSSEWECYKVQVCIMDDYGTASFVLWDRDVEQQIKIGVFDLREHLVKREDNMEEDEPYPSELISLVGKTMLFKINLRRENISRQFNTYIVRKMCDDPDIIKKFDGDVAVEQVHVADPSMIDLGECDRLSVNTENIIEGEASSGSREGDFVTPEKRSIDAVSNSVEDDMSLVRQSTNIKYKKIKKENA